MAGLAGCIFIDNRIDKISKKINLIIGIFYMGCVFDGICLMKKNKFRSNNYNNQGYSLSYKFDSVSPAGKCCGTALDLIKRYNDLAKEAHGNGNYVEAEVFRQYAEHYRKIVTEINERRQRFDNRETPVVSSNGADINPEVEQAAQDNNELSPTVVQIDNVTKSANDEPSLVETKAKKSLKIIEITDNTVKPRRNCKPREKKVLPEQTENA